MAWQSGATPYAERARERERARQEREKAWLALVLAWVAGFVDATGYVVLFRIFTAHMSGNSVAMGAYLGQGDWAEAIRRGFPVPFFVLGVVLGVGIIEWLSRRGSRRKLTAVLVPEVVLLGAFLLYGRVYLQESRIQPQAAWSFFLLVALAVVAMGLQTASLRRAGGVAIHTTYVTGMLTHFAEEAVTYLFWLRARAHSWRRLRVALWASPRQTSFVRAALLGSVWVLYAMGAVSSGFLVLRWGLLPLVLPIVVLLVVIGLDIVRPIQQP
jgi:uncharacterized membrane protein YoaK (UPF0700 family)